MYLSSSATDDDAKLRLSTWHKDRNLKKTDRLIVTAFPSTTPPCAKPARPTSTTVRRNYANPSQIVYALSGAGFVQQTKNRDRHNDANLLSHVPQVSDVCPDGLPESVQVDVLHPVLLAHLLDDGGDRRVVVLRYGGESGSERGPTQRRRQWQQRHRVKNDAYVAYLALWAEGLQRKLPTGGPTPHRIIASSQEARKETFDRRPTKAS